MKRIYKTLGVCVLAAAAPVVWVSAQQFPSGQMQRQDPRFDATNRAQRQPFLGSTNSTSTPTSTSTSSGNTGFSVMPLPKEFALLNDRSIFSKDHHAISNDKKPIFNTTPSKLVYRGVIREGNQFKATIEDTSTSRPPEWVEPGKILTMNGARINEITLDHIIVTKPGGATRKIRVGENLEEGEVMSGPAPVAAGAALPTTRPAPTAAGSTTGTAGDDAILAMMRERRQKELGQ